MLRSPTRQPAAQRPLTTLRTAALLLVCATLTACSNQLPLRDHSIGIVMQARGSPNVIRAGKSYILGRQSRIFVNDIIETNKVSRLTLTMRDDTELAIAASSRLVMTQYKFQRGGRSASAHLTLTRGALRTNTGRITEVWRSAFQIRTPFAAIEADGNEFWTGMIFGDNTLDVAMLKGRQLTVTNEHGSVRIDLLGAGTTVRGGAAPSPPLPWGDRKGERAMAATH